MSEWPGVESFYFDLMKFPRLQSKPGTAIDNSPAQRIRVLA